MSKMIALEVLIATPPTVKCEQTVAVLEEVVRLHPDDVRLVVFRRGVDFMPEEMQPRDIVPEEDCAPKEASLQMRILITKGRAVPTVVLAGVLFSTAEVPDLAKLDAAVHEVLRAG